MNKITKHGKIIKQKPYGHYVKAYISMKDMKELKVNEGMKVKITIEK